MRTLLSHGEYKKNIYNLVNCRRRSWFMVHVYGLGARNKCTVITSRRFGWKTISLLVEQTIISWLIRIVAHPKLIVSRGGTLPPHIALLPSSEDWVPTWVSVNGSSKSVSPSDDEKSLLGFGSPGCPLLLKANLCAIVACGFSFHDCPILVSSWRF